jgi:hypothetical protein
MQTDTFELTIEQMLLEPIVRVLMARDGIAPDDIRRLLAETRAKVGSPPTTSMAPSEAAVTTPLI